MSDLFQYGTNTKLSIPGKLDDRWTIADIPRGEEVADVRGVARAALREPLEFPPLSKSVVEGDLVAVAVGPNVPKVGEVVAAVIYELLEAGIEADDITVVCTQDEPLDPRHVLPAMLRGRVTLDRHDPAHHDGLEFLTSNRKGRAVYLNRAICDAGMLVAIGAVQPAEGHNFQGLFSGLYPPFSDADTQTRYRNPRLLDPTAPLGDRARLEVEKVSWLAGALFAVQVLPAGPESVAAILAGDPRRVAQESQRQYTRTWSCDLYPPAELVVAAIRGDERQQTWDNIARTMITASRLIDDRGAIVICSELAAAPEEGVRGLIGDSRWERTLRRLDNRRPVDALTAVAIAATVEHIKVYLLSKLDADLVGELGMEPVGDVSDVVRLMQRHENCLLVPNAQYAVASRSESPTPRKERPK